jgi:hypothetical protein
MMRRALRQRVLRVAALGAAVVVLGLVFSAYLQPDLVFDLANRVWSCF